MLLRPGNAGSNTAADHLSVLDQALGQIPDRWRSNQVLIRANGAGYSHALIAALAEQQLEFSVGYPSPTRSGTPSGSSRPGPGTAPTTLTVGCASTPTLWKSPAWSTCPGGPAPAPRCG